MNNIKFIFNKNIFDQIKLPFIFTIMIVLFIIIVTIIISKVRVCDKNEKNK